MSPPEKREAQNTLPRKGQNTKGLLESIFEKSVQDPLALEQSFHPPDINQVSRYVIFSTMHVNIYLYRRSLFNYARPFIACSMIHPVRRNCIKP